MQEYEKRKEEAVAEAERRVTAVYEDRMVELTTLQAKMASVKGKLVVCLPSKTLSLAISPLNTPLTTAVTMYAPPPFTFSVTRRFERRSRSVCTCFTQRGTSSRSGNTSFHNAPSIMLLQAMQPFYSPMGLLVVSIMDPL